MIVSWNWLTQYVHLDMSAEALTERLALAGLNHESTTEVGGDLAIDLEVTSNRADCLSHIGVAREIAVLFQRGLCVPDPHPRESGARVETKTSIQVDATDLCPRFTARVVTGCTIGESPWWLRKRLETLGVRPISNVVDVTNYVLFECGQPLHAYDLDRLKGRRLIVRRAIAPETLQAINGKSYDLTPEMLVIADGQRPVGLAGVMGGLETEIGPATTSVLIEAAQFDPVAIRRTARALGLHSPSSYRFERGLDPERTDWASRRCAELIMETAGGRLHPGVINTGTATSRRASITLRLSQIPRVLGIEIDRETCGRILLALGLVPVDASEGALCFEPPRWRADLEREIDLIEEVARIHGYDQIPEDRVVPLARSSRGPRERVEELVRDALTGMGFDEAVTYSLVGDDRIDSVRPGPGVEPIRAEHSSRKRENLLRTSLVPSLLHSRAHNEAHGEPDARLFEIANVYLADADGVLPHEPTRLGIVSGADYLGIKAAVETLLDHLHLREVIDVRPATLGLFTAGRAAELIMGGESVGYIGEVAQSRLEACGLRGACSAAELEFDLIQARAELIPQFRHLPPFPGVARDLSLVVDQSLPWSELAHAVREGAGPWLEVLEYLDTFHGGNVPEGRHSLHFGLRFRHTERTLTGEEVDRAVQAVIDVCTSRFAAVLR